MTDRILRARKRVRTPPSIIREGWNDGVLLTLGGKCIAGQDVGVQKQGRRQRERLVRQASQADLGFTCVQALTLAPGNDLPTLGLHCGSPNANQTSTHKYNENMQSNPAGMVVHDLMGQRGGLPWRHDNGASSAIRSWIANHSENPLTARTRAASFLYPFISGWAMVALLSFKYLWVTPGVVMASNVCSKVGGFPCKSNVKNLSHFIG